MCSIKEWQAKKKQENMNIGHEGKKKENEKENSIKQWHNLIICIFVTE